MREVRRRGRWRIATGLIGALGVAGTVGALLVPRSARGPVRSEPPPAASDAAPLDLILSLPSECRRARCGLAWRGPPGYVFRLRVLTEDLEVLRDVALLGDTSFEVPVADLERVQSGDGILWQVTAQSPAGQTLRSITYREALE